MQTYNAKMNAYAAAICTDYIKNAAVKAELAPLALDCDRAQNGYSRGKVTLRKLDSVRKVFTDALQVHLDSGAVTLGDDMFALMRQRIIMQKIRIYVKHTSMKFDRVIEINAYDFKQLLQTLRMHVECRFEILPDAETPDNVTPPCDIAICVHDTYD